MDEMMEPIKSYFGKLAKPMIEFKDLRCFRSLITEEEGSDKPLYRIKKHPKLVIRDGVVSQRG